MTKSQKYSKTIAKIQHDIHNVVFSHKGVLEMHDFYLDLDTTD